MKRQKSFLGIVIITFILLLTMSCKAVPRLFVTPTPTSTPTLTPTPTFTPTLTPTPTNTPTPTPDFSSVKLTLDDLPAGFEEIPPEEIGFDQEELEVQGLPIQNAFSFVNVEDFEFIMAFNTLLPRKVDKLSFDALINNPDVLADSFANQLGASNILEEEELETLSDIGDTSGGITVLVSIEGIPARIDLVMFRRGAFGTLTMVMYFNQHTPPISIEEIVTLLDERTVEALEKNGN